MNPKQQYESRLAHWRQVLEREDKRYRQISDLRLWIVVAGLAIAWWSLAWIAVPVVAFLALIVWHVKVDARRIDARRGIAYFDRGLKRIDGKWTGTGTPGERFKDSNHVYAEDLDVFGRGSLFELLCTARTAAGEDVLADWLLHPADTQTVRQRQDSVKELAPQVDLRETAALAGEDIRANWRLKQTPAFPSYSPACSVAVSMAAIVSLAGFVAGWWSSAPFLASALVALGLSYLLREQIILGLDALEASTRELDLLVRLLHHLEERTFTTAMLKRLRDTVTGSSKEVAYLKRLMTLADTGRNAYLLPLTIPVLWNVHVSYAMWRWQERHRNAVDAWMKALAEFEALSSIACHAFENPGHAVPELTAKSEFVATQLGHPLLASTQCVTNDVEVGVEGARMVIVSGSNMSGKSTLLRSIGLNTILAWAGANVRASRLEVGPLAVGASLRTADSIQDGKSRFYAEITRLKQITDLTSGGKPVLFLLDELLSGTNSHDRRIGAEGILKALLERGAVGLVTTHDLALASIADIGGMIRNVHFEDHVENGEIRFDYKMRQGVVTRSNALELMRAVGLLR
jgi:hypothetical protein